MKLPQRNQGMIFGLARNLGFIFRKRPGTALFSSALGEAAKDLSREMGYNSGNNVHRKAGGERQQRVQAAAAREQ